MTDHAKTNQSWAADQHRPGTNAFFSELLAPCDALYVVSGHVKTLCNLYFLLVGVVLFLRGVVAYSGERWMHHEGDLNSSAPGRS